MGFNISGLPNKRKRGGDETVGEFERAPQVYYLLRKFSSRKPQCKNELMFVSVTRLQLRSLRFLPQFLLISEKTVRQLLASPGFCAGQLRTASAKVFWTVTIWQDEASMRRYRGSGAHSEAMKRLAHWCDEASVSHWAQNTENIPDWETMHSRMQEQGRRSKVDRPSPRHLAEPWIVPRPRWRIERTLCPNPKAHLASS